MYLGIKNIASAPTFVFNGGGVFGLEVGQFAIIEKDHALKLSADLPTVLTLLDEEWTNEALAGGTITINTAYGDPVEVAEVTEQPEVVVTPKAESTPTQPKPRVVRNRKPKK